MYTLSDIIIAPSGEYCESSWGQTLLFVVNLESVYEAIVSTMSTPIGAKSPKKQSVGVYF